MLAAALITVVGMAPAHSAAVAAGTRPVPSGTLAISGTLQDGSTITATGLTWTAPANAVEMMVQRRWLSCAGSSCRTAANVGVSPYIATLIPAAPDVGRTISLTETAIAVTAGGSHETASVTTTTASQVAAYPQGQPPTSQWINGLPESQTGSDQETFQADLPHGNPSDGALFQQYSVDNGAWTAMAATRIFTTPVLTAGGHTAAVRTANAASQSTTLSFSWTVVQLPAPVACSSCWHPPHLDATGHPMRWDWQIGASTPVQRTASNGGPVDIYDVDGFLSTPAQVSAIRSTWTAATLPHPRAICYISLGSWEDFRPDAASFPVAALGKTLQGYPSERWVDVRQVSALLPAVQGRIDTQCAAKGFDAVEVDNIDGFDPSAKTGFWLTAGDQRAFLAAVFNRIHQDGMAGIWKNEPYLTSWALSYTDGAIVEECYRYSECTAAQNNGSHGCLPLGSANPCGWDDFTSTGRWVGAAEYAWVCAPGASCPSPRRTFSAYCSATHDVANGFAAAKFDLLLDARTFYPCP